jgi:hypothetical protein
VVISNPGNLELQLFLCPVILQQLQDMEEKRINKVQECISQCAEIEKNVIPIINTCIEGMFKASASINAAQVSIFKVLNPCTASCEDAMSLSVPSIPAPCEKFPHCSQLKFE